MRSLKEIIENPKKRKEYGFEHSSTKLLLKVPKEWRTSAIESVLLKRHKRLAYSVAIDLWKRYKNRLGASIDYDDIFAAAMCGLLVAVRRFDPRYANEFSTYAINWIRQSALREIENNIGISRIPVHYISRLRNLELRKNESDYKYACFIDFAFVKYLSLNSSANDDQELIQLLPSNNLLNEESIIEPYQPEIELLRKDLIKRIENSIDELMSLKNSKIVKMRFGLGNYGRAHTLEEVGENFGLSRERIRQIVEKYLEKARKKHIFENDELDVFRRFI